MPIPSSIADLDSDPSGNYPKGSDEVGTTVDDYIRAGFAIQRQMQRSEFGIPAANTLAVHPDAVTFYVDGPGVDVYAISDRVIGGEIRIVFQAAGVKLVSGGGLSLPTGLTSITTLAGDNGEFINDRAGHWTCMAYHRADGSTIYGPGYVKRGGDTLSGEYSFIGNLKAASAEVTSNLKAASITAASAQVTGNLKAASAEVTDGVRAGWVEVATSITAAHIQATGSLKAAYYEITGDLKAASITAASAQVTGTLKAASTEVTGNLKAASTEVTGDLKAAAITAASAEVTGNLKAASLTLSGSVLVVAKDSGLIDLWPSTWHSTDLFISAIGGGGGGGNGAPGGGAGGGGSAGDWVTSFRITLPRPPLSVVAEIGAGGAPGGGTGGDTRLYINGIEVLSVAGGQGGGSATEDGAGGYGGGNGTSGGNVSATGAGDLLTGHGGVGGASPFGKNGPGGFAARGGAYARGGNGRLADTNSGAGGGGGGGSKDAPGGLGAAGGSGVISISLIP